LPVWVLRLLVGRVAGTCNIENHTARSGCATTEETPLISPPALDAVLNGTSAILVTVGYVMIRTKRVLAHKICMLAATTASAAFLISYVTYHYHLYAAGEAPVHFPGTGAPRYAYLAMLTTHTILAIVIVPLVIMSLVRALRSNFPAHKRIARWTLPLWAYVSVTGVLIYVVLYQIYAPPRP